MNPYQSYVSSLARLVREGHGLPLGGQTNPVHSPVPDTAPRVLIFSPHPDDEVIIGGLALRLLRALRWKVVNVAVTLGSKKERQLERWSELQKCCEFIGFGLLPTADAGLEGINLEHRKNRPEQWAVGVRRIQQIIGQHRPRVIFFPHDDDWNVTHIGTHHLVVDALKALERSFSCFTVETEFWGAMDTPNLLVESSEEELADLIAALSFHAGEVRRNPYHLLLPAWMMDNVRRGGELVGGQGEAAPDFLFGTLYRLRRWGEGAFVDVLPRGRFISKSDDVAGLFLARA
jgi:LmbE family N-acetylglucosaminyl deacetylase